MTGFEDNKKSQKKIKKNLKNNNIKKQIINQAFKFHSQGNISEAVKLYQKLISKGFADQRVFLMFFTPTQ